MTSTPAPIITDSTLIIPSENHRKVAMHHHKVIAKHHHDVAKQHEEGFAEKTHEITFKAQEHQDMKDEATEEVAKYQDSKKIKTDWVYYTGLF